MITYGSGPAAERHHVAKIGHGVFARIKIAAYVSIKADARLISAEKIRHELAHEAALRASGFSPRSVPKASKDQVIPDDFQEICNQAMELAVAAARAVMEHHV